MSKHKLVRWMTKTVIAVLVILALLLGGSAQLGNPGPQSTPTPTPTSWKP